MKAPLTQTDQLRLSDEHWMAPVLQTVAETAVVVLFAGLVVLNVVKVDIVVAATLVVLVLDGDELEEFDEPPSPDEPLLLTVTLKSFIEAQSEVAGTFVSPAYPPPYSTFVPGLG
jgi:hypothetical protein